MIAPKLRRDPSQVGGYPILGRLGSGGFGTVYVACPLDRPDELVAVKVLRADYAQLPDFRERFFRETEAMMRVSSEYVPRLIDRDAGRDALWFATELVRGPSLHQAVRRCGALPEPVVWRLGLGIAEALEAIHGAELVHRDLKPGNVLLVPEGPRVIDFSLVHLAELDHHLSSQLSMGSYEYVPLEQLRGLRYAGEPADVFALGGTLLFAATGHPPFANREEAGRARVNLAGLLPTALYDVVSQCLYREPGARPPLAQVKAEIARQSGGAGRRDRRGFGAALPVSVMDLIGDWRRELDEVIRMGRGPAAPPLPDGEHERAGSFTPAREGTGFLNHPMPGDGGTLIQPGTAVPLPFGAAPSNVRWYHRFPDWIRAPVAVARNVAVAASLDGTVACFRADNGDVLCRPNLGAPIRCIAMLSGRGWACAGDGEGGMHVIDMVSGGHRPLFHASRAIEGSPVVAADHVYVTSADGLVYEIGGQVLGHRLLFRMNQPCLGAAAAAYGTLFVAGAEGIVAIDIAGGHERWRFPTGGLVYAPPVAAAGRLYFAGTDGALCSVGVHAAEKPEKLGIDVPVHVAMAHDGEQLYVGGSDGVVRAFDISGGGAARPVLVWTRKIGEEIGGIAAKDGRAYCAADDALVELDGGDGRLTGRVPVGSPITAAPAVDGPFVYVASIDGTVSCLSMR